MRIDECLKQEMDKLTPSRVHDAMEYSLMIGGKRIRPNLLYAVGHGYGLSDEVLDPFAEALEMIHTYSLIHDDLPAMDNDDLRRGQPTNHKKFDEATAILAGDGLLTYAFTTAARSGANAESVVKCIRILADMAGADGMVYGQCLDIEEKDHTWEEVETIHRYKTGCLLSAPLMIPAVLAERSDEEVAKWNEIGFMIGLAFQIQDDVLDTQLSAEEFGKSNSDSRNHKSTSVVLLGEDSAVAKMNELYDLGKEAIRSFKGFDEEEVLALIDQVQTRRK